MTPLLRLVVVFLVSIFCGLLFESGNAKRWHPHDRIGLVANTVGPFNNPTETYPVSLAHSHSISIYFCSFFYPHIQNPSQYLLLPVACLLSSVVVYCLASLCRLKLFSTTLYPSAKAPGANADTSKILERHLVGQ